jgi:hypothetical protein
MIARPQTPTPGGSGPQAPALRYASRAEALRYVQNPPVDSEDEPATIKSGGQF